MGLHGQNTDQNTDFMVLRKRLSKFRNFEREPGIQCTENMSIPNWNAWLSLHYKYDNFYLFLNGKGIMKIITKQIWVKVFTFS